MLFSFISNRDNPVFCTKHQKRIATQKTQWSPVVPSIVLHRCQCIGGSSNMALSGFRLSLAQVGFGLLSSKLVKVGALCMFGPIGPITSFSNMKTPQANIQQLQAQKWFLLNPKEGKAAVIAKMLRILNFPSLREPSGRDSQLKPPVHIHGTDNTLHSASSIFKLHSFCRIVKSCSCR